jgi:hypothetical protein
MYGRQILSTNSVFGTRVSADGNPDYKAGGCVLDWTTATTASGDTTLADGSVIKDGQKYFRYGQVITRITSSGLYGRYDPDLTNGRELLTRGRCFILDQTIVQYGSGSSGTSIQNDVASGAFDGGAVWTERILNTGASAHTLAGGPTIAEIRTAFPLLKFVDNA